MSPSGKTRTPKVRLGKVKVIKGEEDLEFVKRALRVNWGRHMFCYVTALKKTPELTGRITVRFTIEPGGTASNIENVSSDFKDAELVDCMVKGFDTVKLEARERGLVIVEAPLMFFPVAPERAVPVRRGR